MSDFDRHESNKWAQAAAAAGQEYLEARSKVLTDGAGRGFPLVPGESLSALIQAGLKARQKLTEAGGKIFEEERGRILELSDFNLKIIIENARLTVQVLKNALKRYEEEVQHQLRGEEINNELLVESEETGVAALRLLKEQVRRTLKQYENDIRSQVLALKLLNDEGKIDLGLLMHLTRLTINDMAQVALDQNEVHNVGNILNTELNNMRTVSQDLVKTTKASALQQTSTEEASTGSHVRTWISKM